MNYDLSRLGPDEFEHMTQALAKEMIGGGVEAYGDGSDGGRDAAYRGATSYPAPGPGAWNGYIVIQAKFRESTGGKPVAQWLNGHLARELRRWVARRDQGIEVPEYLIVSTNVELTSVAGVGGKDQVEKKLRSLIGQLGLPIRAWHIWDYVEICRFLDVCEGVRHAYAHLITPGDVLTKLEIATDKLAEAALSAEQTRAPSPPDELPAQRRFLVGRHTEAARCMELVDNRVPGEKPNSAVCLVVTGAPGIGKTALALHVAWQLRPTHDGGQVYVTCRGSVRDGEDLIDALLRSFDADVPLADMSAAQRTARLAQFIRRGRCLILIDDVPAEDALAQLLSIDGDYTVIATSRVKLSGLAGMIEYVDLEPLTPEGSTALVRQIVAEDRLSSGELSALSDICRGHPLALHIASSRIARRPLTSVAGYLRQLADPATGITALRIGDAAVGPVIELSYAVLSSAQQQLVRALGTLPHITVTPDVAAAAIAATYEEITAASIAEACGELDELVEYSLIEQVGDQRFAMHEILHRFARLKSAELDQAARVASVSNVCLLYAVRGDQALRLIAAGDTANGQAESKAEALRSFEDDLPGAMATTQMAHGMQLWDMVALLSGMLSPGLLLRGRWVTMEQLQRLLWSAGRHTGNLAWQAAAALNTGSALSRLGKTAQALEALAAGAEIARQDGNVELMALAMTQRCTIDLNLGDVSRALAILRDLANVWRRLGNDQALAIVLSHLAKAYEFKGDYRRAHQYVDNSRRVAERAGFANSLVDATASVEWHIAAMHGTGDLTAMAERRIEAARAIGDLEAEAAALGELAQHELIHGNTGEQIETALRSALEIYRATGDSRGTIRGLVLEGFLHARRGEIQAAYERYIEAGELAEQTGEVEQRIQIYLQLACLVADGGRSDEANELFGAAIELAVGSGSERMHMFALMRFADSLLIREDYHMSLEVSAEAVKYAEKSQDVETAGEIRIIHAEALFKTGSWRTAATLLEQEVERAGVAGARENKLKALRVLGNLYAARGLYAEADTYLRSAVQIEPTDGERDAWAHCLLARANLFARRGEWARARQLAAQAAQEARRLKNLRLLATAAALEVSCALQDADDATAIERARGLLETVAQLGMPSLQATGRSRIAIRLAGEGRYDEALSDAVAAVSLADQSCNDALRATLRMNLGHIYCELGRPAEAAEVGKQAALAFERAGQFQDAAGAVLLTGRWMQLDQAPDVAERFDQLVDEVGCGPKVRDAITAYGTHVGELAGGVGKVREGGAVHVADEVRAAMGSRDIGPTIEHLLASAVQCGKCGLRIVAGTPAELVIIRDAQAGSGTLCVTHSDCLESRVIDVAGMEPSSVYSWTECVIWLGVSAAVVIDCQGGVRVNEDGTVTDQILGGLRALGFSTLVPQDLDAPFPRLDSESSPGKLRAQLVGRVLHIELDGRPVHKPIPLDFNAKWYSFARTGRLLAIFGRDLPGSYVDEPRHLRRAVRREAAVGAVMPVTIVPPRRNGPCICNPSRGLKYRDCCGK
ncbi:MAG TPA: NB-ARC domain-containing protein [Actinocrinis sp.]|uniref:NB-ARC domain-containing protein n=1 Tax=Actinocrinis sp. TaxID=1920516 RepID=UPI002DDD9E40|nr:NB-ARC domain-containing protein [Actinocrinis sp.]HEV2347051.1 NB-ARC domain-containing protein [Actinocrinis sp.]